MELWVPVSTGFSLNAGRVETVVRDGRRVTRILPPETSLYEQVLTYLWSKPMPARGPVSFMREGIAATAVCLRWGTYFAVLADRSRPLWPIAAAKDQEGVSRVDDSEMARINIESTAALEWWVDFRHQHRGLEKYTELVDRAWAYLPMPQHRVPQSKRPIFFNHSAPAIIEALRPLVAAGELGDALSVVERFPSRAFANALVSYAWRNGPIEDLHSGKSTVLPLDMRRVTPREERTLMRDTGTRMTEGMVACDELSTAHAAHDWPICVLPLYLTPSPYIIPTDWSMTEISRIVELRQS